MYNVSSSIGNTHRTTIHPTLTARMGFFQSIPRLTQTYHTQSYDRIAKHHGFDGSGKTIVVTGGANGVGFSISRAFAAAGAARIAIISRSAGDQKAAKEALQVEYPATEILTYQASVTDAGRMCDILLDLWQVDVLVLNAAVAHRRAPGIEISVQDMQEAFDTNVVGPFGVTKAYLSMPNPVKKTVINVSSVASQLSGYRIGYGPSKAAATQVMQHFAAEQKDGNVKIVSFHPGAIWTPGTEKTLGKIFSKDAPHWESIDLPAHFALWLSGPESDFLHGRFVWAQWDVDELIALKEKLEKEPNVLTMGLVMQELK